MSPHQLRKRPGSLLWAGELPPAFDLIELLVVSRLLSIAGHPKTLCRMPQNRPGLRETICQVQSAVMGHQLYVGRAPVSYGAGNLIRFADMAIASRAQSARFEHNGPVGSMLFLLTRCSNYPQDRCETISPRKSTRWSRWPSWKNTCRVSEYARKFQADYAEKPMNRLRRTKEETPKTKDRLAQMEAFMLPGDRKTRA